MIAYKNTTGKGNVVAYEIHKVHGCQSPLGDHHVSVVAVFRSGKRDTIDGQYFKNLNDAEDFEAEYIRKMERTPGLEYA